MSEEYRERDLIYALDIGTRSIIGMVGHAEDDKFRVLAIEKEEHSKRTMLDGQIEDIPQVAKVVRSVTKRLEQALGIALKSVCIAAAGRALHTETGHYAISLPSSRHIDHDLVSELEAGAVANAEAALPQSENGGARFYLVGYSVTRYQLDRYPMATLVEHNGQFLEVDVVATFLPGEVVESLYSTMRLADLEVASLTLEPIAALNAVIPAELRLLNLVLADIGAGTTDIAICREGSVVGYTMATIAGDEISEAIMKALLVDFKTAERLKAELSAAATLHYTDVLGFEQSTDCEDLFAAVVPSAQTLAEELSKRILAVNGAAPSAIFLSGGGSKLHGLRELVAACLDMNTNRIAVAGNNFQISAVSDDYVLNDPEYATPLGIAVSASLGLIHDSYRVTLNGEPAKLFRSGTLRALDILMMNGYHYSDLIGRGGQTLSVTIDGQRVLFWGEPSTPSVLKVNDVEAPPSTVIHTADRISFTPASPGKIAEKTFAEAVGGPEIAAVSLLNGAPAAPDHLLSSGDVILRNVKRLPESAGNDFNRDKNGDPEAEEGQSPAQPSVTPLAPPVGIRLNDKLIALPPKQGGDPYFLMDMLEHSGIDFKNLSQNVLLQVNGLDVPFTYPLKDNDSVTIALAELS